MFEKLCLVSSRASIYHNKISIFAFFEILLSICLYWYIIPVYFNTYYHIVFMLAITPFFLLRSDDSQKEALEFLQDFFNKEKHSFSKTILAVLTIGILLSLVYFLTNYLSLHWLMDYEGSSLFWRSLFMGLGLVVGVAVVVVVVGAVAVGVGTVGVGTGVVGVGIVVGVVGDIVGVVGAVGVIVGAIGAIGAIGVIGVIGIGAIGAGVGAIGVAVGTVGVGVGVVGVVVVGIMIIIILSVLIKVFVGIKHPLKGINSIAFNWKTINLYQDISYPPEILIGINNFNGLDKFKLGSSAQGNNIQDTVLNFTMKVLYIPAIIYRISLKSTAWMYSIFFMIIPYFVNTKLENQYMANRLQNMFLVVVSVGIIFISIGNNIFDIKYLSDISAFIHSYSLLKSIMYLLLSYAICTLMLYPFGFFLKKDKSSTKRYVTNFIRYIQMSSLVIAILISILFIHNEFYPIENISYFLDYIQTTFLKSLEDASELFKKAIAHIMLKGTSIMGYIGPIN